MAQEVGIHQYIMPNRLNRVLLHLVLNVDLNLCGLSPGAADWADLPASMLITAQVFPQPPPP
jgi:hypothetical protein